MADQPFFKGLAPEKLEPLLKHAEIQEYKKSHQLFHAGDKAKSFYVILQGWVKLYRLTTEGDEAVLAIFSKGDVFGEAAIFEGSVYPFSAEIAEDAKLLNIPSSALKESARQDQDVVNRIMVSMSREMDKLRLENEHLSIMTAPQRVGCLLLNFSTHIKGNGGKFTFPYDKALAAARLGMKPETFSRALSQLKPFSVTVSGSEIHIENFDALLKYVCGHCSAMNGECRGAKASECNSACTKCCGD